MMPKPSRPLLRARLRGLMSAACAVLVGLAPSLAAAQGRPKISLVNDRSFNAFVANGQKIFINVGALMDAETPNEIIGVLAHETGHIQGGHLARLREQLANAQILSV